MNLPKVSSRTVLWRIWGFDIQDASEMRYAAMVSIYVRWGCLFAALVETSYRIEYGSLSHLLNSLYLLVLMAASGLVWLRIRTSGWVDPRWLLALSALDLAALVVTTSLSRGFDSRYFPMYYFGVAVFAWLFTSPYLVFSWTTLVGGVYVALCVSVGDGVDLAQQDEKAIFYRVLSMYGVALSANLIRFERVRGLRAEKREGELNRQRIEMSQTIHDTTAQSAYMLGLGLEQAIEMSERSDPELTGKLEAMSLLSKSTMWEPRHPIDGGEIFSGGTLSEVLAVHVDTFTVITSIPAELVQNGDEPALSVIERSLLFSIAHNALTNAFRHSGAGGVTVMQDFTPDRLVLAVSDDGVGLPMGYSARGHGFRNMTAAADRLGGVLDVRSDHGGTTVRCSVPYGNEQGGK